MRLLFFIFFFSPCLAQVPPSMSLSNAQGQTFIIHPNGLAISLQATDTLLPLTVPCPTHFSEPIAYQQDTNHCALVYPNNIHVRLSIQAHRLHVQIYPPTDQIIHWPAIQEHPRLKAYLIPEGSGLYVPVAEQGLLPCIAGLTLENPTLPFWGYLYDQFTITLILHTPVRTTFVGHNHNPEGVAAAHHFQYDFRKRDQHPCYEISFTYAKPHILAPARIFKAFLKASGTYTTLFQKSQTNPLIKKLGGAIHAYLWGTGRTQKALHILKALGITRIWLGYEEQKPSTPNAPWENTAYVDQAYIQLAHSYGYVIGPYDAWHTMQPPKDCDCHNTNFGDFFPRGCVRTPDQKIKKGFAGRGCYVSMMALAQLQHALVYDRFHAFKKQGITTYFLDCHATGEAFDDYSKDHPQTIGQDLAIREQHLRYLAQQAVVLGSETAAYWAIPFLAFSHGSESTLYQLHWELTRDKQKYGSWWPPKRPAFFFKSLPADERYATRYDPRYRIPLWQAVFHESCVATDRWEIPLVKFTNLYVNRFLLEFLYGVPSMWSIDLAVLQAYRPILQQLATDFTPFHQAIMMEPLSDFRFVTPDRRVQETTFGKVLRVTANFRKEPFHDVPPQSVKIQNLQDHTVKYVTPCPLPTVN